MARKTAYHHGDLRQALFDTGLAMLEEVGLEGTSLRKIAARVGVSHAAPEHHFPTLRHLFNAMAIEGFIRFRASMLDAMRMSDANDADQLRGAMRGYLAFAVSHPNLFRLMFNKNSLDWDDPRLGEAAQPARQVLADICKPAAIRMGVDTPQGRISIEHLVWSHIHGYAHLVIDQKIAADSAVTGAALAPPFDLAGLLLPMDVKD
ncbi:TetR/AcrR family transcriptional regulator [Rhizobium sp. NRK18]|uniref:TetR/AcrR family transcriptional regulator n=1 Tax=Rhizobium sp. NRK18 TaxID=2964667 RepID=UPI0021C4C640|nr:TetR/AcrR family transcriptional regulator [Rhizobium sp. NRK18]MCQ2004665.1 TetR/AcrR family transcriptional regulator [Rhizobium sp. NRK18]